MAKPRIDLGRQGELITWNEWIGRAGEAARRHLDEAARDALRLIVTLRDGRRICVSHTEVHAHDPGEDSPMAAITGYVFLGHYLNTPHTERVVSIAVPPYAIASVEWNELPEEKDADKTFGFAAAHQKPGDTTDEIQDDKEIHGAVSLITTTSAVPLVVEEDDATGDEAPAPS